VVWPNSLVRALLFATAPLGVCAALPARALADGIDEGTRFRSIGLQGNPLDLVVGRYSLNLEYLPASHHAVHVAPFGVYALPGVADQLTGFGGELGYRWYSGAHGPHGVFVGASVVAAELEYQHTAAAPAPLDLSNDTQFVELGGAIDAGYQAIILESFAVGAGVGAQYIVDTIHPHFEFASHPWHDLVYGWGLRPRVLLSVGTAF
jgi:hypothetical protein